MQRHGGGLRDAPKPFVRRFVSSIHSLDSKRSTRGLCSGRSHHPGAGVGPPSRAGARPSSAEEGSKNVQSLAPLGERLPPSLHERGHIQLQLAFFRRKHHLNFGPNDLRTKNKRVARNRVSLPLDLGAGTVGQCATWAHGCAHRLFPCRSPVVTHVALHHLVEIHQVARYSEWTGQDTVRTSDATRLECRLDNAISSLLDCVRGTNLGAGRLFAMHAHYRNCLWGLCPIHIFQMNHGNAAMSLAFGAGVVARLAADAARRVNKEFHLWIDH